MDVRKPVTKSKRLLSMGATRGSTAMVMVDTVGLRGSRRGRNREIGQRVLPTRPAKPEEPEEAKRVM